MEPSDLFHYSSIPLQFQARSLELLESGAEIIVELSEHLGPELDPQHLDGRVEALLRLRVRPLQTNGASELLAAPPD